MPRTLVSIPRSEIYVLKRSTNRSSNLAKGRFNSSFGNLCVEALYAKLFGDVYPVSIPRSEIYVLKQPQFRPRRFKRVCFNSSFGNLCVEAATPSTASIRLGLVSIPRSEIYVLKLHHGIILSSSRSVSIPRSEIYVLKLRSAGWTMAWCAFQFLVRKSMC